MRTCRWCGPTWRRCSQSAPSTRSSPSPASEKCSPQSNEGGQLMNAKTHRSSRVRGTLLGLLPALALTGCLHAPEYKKPDVGEPGQFRLQVTATDSKSIADLPWWAVFD